MLAKSAPLTELPKSMEAYRAYISGFETMFTGDATRSRDQFYRASTLDSTFVNGLTWAALEEWGLSYDVPKVDSLLKIVEGHRGDLLPFDLASLEYLRAWVDGDVEGAQVAARQRAALGGAIWNIFAVQGAMRLNRIDEAYERIREVFKSPSSLHSSTHWAYLANVLHARGEHGRELQEVRKGIAQVGDDPDLLSSEVRALAALGRIDELRARLESARAKGRRSSFGSDIDLVAVTDLRAHGRSAEADRVARIAVQKHSQAVAAASTWRARFELAHALFEASAAEADTIFSALTSEGLPSQYGQEHFEGLDAAALGYLGVSAAARGDTNGAEGSITRLEKLQRPYILGANLHWQARIAAELGQCERAVRFLSAGLENGSAYQQSAGHLSEFRQFAKLRCESYQEFMKPKR